MKKIVVGIPTQGNTQAEALHSIWLQAFHLGRLSNSEEFEFFFKPAGRLFTPMAREKIVEDSLNLGADYVFMVDDDMVFSSDLFEKLYRHQVDVVAALAFTRNPPHLPVMYETRKGWDPIERRTYFENHWIKNYPKDKLVEVDAVGFGAVLINCKVFQRMKPPYFMCSAGTGEDIWFCINAKESGARIFMDTSTKVGHLSGPIIVGEEESKKYNDPEMQEKLYGAYKKYGVYEVGHFEEIEDADKKEVVLGT